jgi:predicted kinase
MLIAMAGLPGAGKSTVAAGLAARLHGLIVSKDEVRASLFLPGEITYSREQDDLCMAVVYLIAGHIHRADPERTIIVDGRTFSRAYQVADLCTQAAAIRLPLTVIECVCDEATARERLERDQHTGAHPAGNRSFALHLAVREQAEPITIEHVTVDTGTGSRETVVERCLTSLQQLAQGKVGRQPDA